MVRLALMSENVSWPKASEGGRVVGKEEIRAYWTRQWKEFDPHVEPLEVIDREGSSHSTPSAAFSKLQEIALLRALTGVASPSVTPIFSFVTSRSKK